MKPFRQGRDAALPLLGQLLFQNVENAADDPPAKSVMAVLMILPQAEIIGHELAQPPTFRGWSLPLCYRHAVRPQEVAQANKGEKIMTWEVTRRMLLGCAGCGVLSATAGLAMPTVAHAVHGAVDNKTDLRAPRNIQFWR